MSIPFQRRAVGASVSAISLGLLMILGACGGAPRDGGVAEVGTGTTSFDSLTTDEELILIAGPQGGHHFILNARIADLTPGSADRPDDPANPSTSFAVFFDGERVDLPSAPLSFGYEDTGDGFATLRSGRIVQVFEDRVDAMRTQQVTVAVTVTDIDGRRATDERTIIAAPDPEEN